MTSEWNRRDILKGFAAVSGVILTGRDVAQSENGSVDGAQLELQVTPVSDHTLRFTLLPNHQASRRPIPGDGALVQESWGSSSTTLPEPAGRELPIGNFRLSISWRPLSIAVANASGKNLQQLDWDENSGALSFLTGTRPLLGLGEGGPQYDRRGSTDEMRSGQGGYKLATHGGRVPIPWIIGTEGWAIFFHQPFGTFDFTRERSKFIPKPRDAALLLDLFLVAATDPPTIMAEYARLTGLPELPPLWSLGYQQSHRTLANREELIAEAKTFRQKKLPCDAMIYLGTGFCPSGWNTENGSFAWNSRVFADPKEVLEELHKEHFRTVMQVVILSDQLHGTVHDRCELSQFNEGATSCYWDAHRRDFAIGIDG